MWTLKLVHHSPTGAQDESKLQQAEKLNLRSVARTDLCCAGVLVGQTSSAVKPDITSGTFKSPPGAEVPLGRVESVLTLILTPLLSVVWSST